MAWKFSEFQHVPCNITNEALFSKDRSPWPSLVGLVLQLKDRLSNLIWEDFFVLKRKIKLAAKENKLIAVTPPATAHTTAGQVNAVRLIEIKLVVKVQA